MARRNPRQWMPLLPIALLAVSCGGDGTSQQDGAVASPAPAPAEQPVTIGEELFSDPLDDDRNAWGEADSEGGSNQFEDGMLRVQMRAAPMFHWLSDGLAQQSLSGELPLDDVVVEVTQTIEQGAGVAGLFCYEQPGASSEYVWYEFVLRDGFSAIRRSDDRGNVSVLAEGTADAPTGSPVDLQVSCVGGGESPVQLAMSVDGTRVLAAEDPDPLGTEGVMVGVQVWEAPDGQDADPTHVAWDDFVVARATRS